MNFYNFLRLNLFYFQLCGFYPHRIIRTLHSTVDTILIWMVTLLNLISVTVQTTMVFYNYNIIFKQKILLGKIIDMSKYAYLTMTCLTILIESIVTIDDQKSFWEISWNLRKNFQKILPASTEASQNGIYKKNLLKTYATIILFICVQIYLDIRRTCIFCSVYTALVFYSFNKYLQYIMYVDVIHQQAVNLGCELERIIDFSVRKSRNKLNDDEKHEIEVFLVKRLKFACFTYVKLYDMSVKVNSAFGWSLIINLVHSYIQIFVDLFWMFQLIKNKLEEYFIGIFVATGFMQIIIKLYFRMFHFNVAVFTDCYAAIYINYSLS